MSAMRTGAAITLGAFLAGVCLAAGPAGEEPALEKSSAVAPAAGVSRVPDNLVKEIASQMGPIERSLSPEEATGMLTERMENVLKLGTEAERKYPIADNLGIVRVHMLQAASFLAKQKRDEAARKQVLRIADRILASKAPPEVKVKADLVATGASLRSTGGAGQADQEIRTLVKRYEKTPADALGCLYGAILALQNRRDALRDELIAALETRYADDAEVRGFLREVGRDPDRGKPFAAQLRRLDGARLTLPEDLPGKVVVIDFWATWCSPCVAGVPRMKELHQAYEPKGVVFVGISLDRSRSVLEEFIKQHGMNWIHTFSGKGWEDPTAAQYGVRGIPSVWVVGKDGKVVSGNAQDNLQQVIQQALEAK